MALEKFKKIVFSFIAASITASSLVACGSSDNVGLTLENTQVLQPNNSMEAAANEISRKFKFGTIIDAKTPRVKFDVPKKNGLFGWGKKKVDLRQFDSPIANQGQLGACTAFAVVKGLREFLLIRDHKPLVPLSPLFLYYQERKFEGTVGTDSGARLSSGMKVLQDVGTSPEDIWPYVIANYAIEPVPLAMAAATQYRVSGIKPLDGLKEIKAELDKQNAVVFAMTVYQSFARPVNGVIPVPDTRNEKILGGHALECVGYDDFKGWLIMKNSWGPDWGDHGYFYMPYDIFDLGIVRDAWAATTTGAPLIH
jgi:C1A family cysteine protease